MRGITSTSIARGTGLRDRALGRLSALFERLLRAPWPEPLQHLSGDGWRVIAAHWPSFAELVGSRLGIARTNGEATPAVTEREALSAAIEPEPLPAAQRMSSPSRALAPQADALVAELRGAQGWQARRDAALRLASAVTDNAIDALIEAVRDPSVEVAVAAVTALAGRHRPRVIQALTEILSNREGYFGPATRAAAVAALARSATDDELAPVLAAVRAVDAEVSLAAVLALGERTPSAAASHLLPVLRDGSGFFLPIVRHAAASVLARSGTLTAELAAELLTHEQDPQVREALRASASSSS